MKLDAYGIAAFGLVLLAGVGGSLGAVALGAEDLAMAILAFAGGLLIPMPSPFNRNTDEE